MRLLSLTFEKIGPYVKETKIDFNELGNGLILFTGDTGAGKTMIFDAITYALFGKCSGDRRSEKSLACNLPAAVGGRRPYVELEFEHDGRIYTVSRDLEYSRSGNKNPTPADATLAYGNKVLATKPRAVNTEIKYILGMDEEQWRQIAMLPQGEFMALLDTDGQKRSEILRRIFNTERFKNLQSKLSVMYAEASNKAATSKSVLDSQFDTLRLPEDVVIDRDNPIIAMENVNKWCDEKESELKTMEVVNETYGAAYDNALKANHDGMEAIAKREELKRKCAEKEKLESESDEIEKKRAVRDKAGKAIDLYSMHTKLVSYESEIRRNIADSEESKKDLELTEQQYAGDMALVQTIPEKEAELNDLRLKRDKLGNNLDCINILKSMNPEYDRMNEELQNIEECRKKIAEDLEKNAAQLSELKIKQANADNLDELIKTATDKSADIESKLEAFMSEKQMMMGIESMRKEYAIYSVRFEEANVLFKKRSDDLEVAEELFIRSQAGLLAKNLEDGIPCPVCGNIHHISLASVPEGAPTEKEIKDLRKKKSDAEKTRADIAKTMEIIQTKIDVQQNNIVEYTKGSVDTIKEDFSRIEESLIKQKSEIKAVLVDLHVRKTESEQIIHMLLTTEKERDRMLKTLVDKESAMNAAKSEIDELGKRIAAVKSNVIIEDESKLTENIRNLDSKISQLVATVERIRQSEKEYKSRKEVLLDRINKAKCRLEELMPLRNSLKEAYAIKLNDAGISDDELIELAKIDVQALNKTIADYESQLVACISEIKQINLFLEGKEDVPIEVLQTNLVKAKADLDESNMKMNALNDRILSNREAIARINKAFESSKELLSRANALEEMSKVANGTLAGSDKLPFEMYAQKSYFDDVLSRANERLGMMSNNRYSLIQSDEGGRSSKDALDIVVQDNYSGKARDVGSLSGGESFKTALSLALGLSDIVQSYAAGTNIEALFIDEGFGSLDSESLSQAIRVLEGLSDGDIPVCIISHIDELKSRISKQVLVEGNPVRGSTLEIING